MEMTCGLGFGILLICLLQAELASSWAKEAQRLQNSNARTVFSQADDRLRKFSSSFQNQFRQRFSSPHSVQTKSFNADPAVNIGNDRRLPTRSFTQTRSQPVQSSGRLVKNTLLSKPNSQSTLPAQQGSKRGQRKGYSFRAPQSAAQEKMGSPATLFGPVARGPRSSIRMQTYAQGPARKVQPGLTSAGAKVRSFSPQAAAGKSYLSPQFALNVGGYKQSSRLTSLAAPRSSRVGESAPGYAPVMVQDIPEPFGGSAIRRLKQPTEEEKVPVPKPQQVYTPPQRVPPYNSDRTRTQPGSDWTRVKQNQGPVQKPHQISSNPPRWVPPSNPDLPNVHPASTWTKVKPPNRM